MRRLPVAEWHSEDEVSTSQKQNSCTPEAHRLNFSVYQSARELSWEHTLCSHPRHVEPRGGFLTGGEWTQLHNWSIAKLKREAERAGAHVSELHMMVRARVPPHSSFGAYIEDAAKISSAPNGEQASP